MTTETSQPATTDPLLDTPSDTPIDWEKRYKDLQSFHDKTKGVDPTAFESVQSELASLKAGNYINEQRGLLSQAHPDFEGVIQSEQFGTWIEGQPTAFQESIYDAEKLDGQMASKAIDLFKMEFSQQAPDTSAEAAMAVSGGHRETPEVSNKKQWTYAEIDLMTADEYAAHRDEIRTAISEGRIQ